MIKKYFRIGAIPLMLLAAFVVIPVAMAATTAPQKLVYNGHLLDSSGAAITTSHSVRFSFWTSADYVSTDVTATGSLNITAGTYADWNETFTVTPNSSGYFNVELGSSTSLPDFSAMSDDTLKNLHLQVEVKAASSADTAYELLDRDSSNDSLDRAPLLSVPFALNSDLLDGHDTGTASGSIPVLLTGGLLDSAVIPGATDQDSFVIDSDDSVISGNINLQFGQSLAKVLSYDVDSTYFNFNDDVYIQGNLTVTGAVTVGNYDQGSGTGAGALRWTGSDFEGYDGTNWKSLTSGDKFVGVTTTTMSGSFSTGSLVGYQAANDFCADQFAGSHMCQVDEIITTIDKDVTAFAGSSNAWVAEGAPGYTSDSNDCQGWTSNNNSHLGAWWEFSTDAGVSVASGGGQGYLTNCAVVQSIACCR
ncbi:MAG: hypothetical protein K9M03_04675 [Kiritimatiellales bacterium]|nr:hypothetical protein [Kiritimatiellales bacterium]